MHIEVPHKFSQAQAIDQVKKGLVAAKPQMAGQVVINKEEWEGNTLSFAFTAQRQQVTGTLLVEANRFVVDAKLPLMWRLFEGKIERAISEQVAQLQ